MAGDPGHAAESLASVRELLEQARAADLRGEPAVATQLLEQALALSERLAPLSLEHAAVLQALGHAAGERGEIERAEQLLGRARSEIEQLAPAGLEMATVLRQLARVARRSGDLEASKQLLGRGLEIAQSLEGTEAQREIGRIRQNLGIAAAISGDLETAKDLFRQALAIFEKWHPESIDVSDVLNNLGAAASDQGDQVAAKDFYRRSLALQTKLSPRSLGMAAGWNNLGVVALRQADLAAAEDAFRHALDLYQVLAPESARVAIVLDNLGEVIDERGDPARAMDYFRRAQELQEKLGIGGFELTRTLRNRGLVAAGLGDLETAQTHLRRVLEIFEQSAPESLDVAASLNDLGDLELRRGDTATATTHFLRALEIEKKLAPKSYDTASTLLKLGRAAVLRRDPETARAHLRDALAMFEEVVPGSKWEAEVHHTLATIERESGQGERALEHFERALDALDAQRPRLGGSEEIGAGFAARYTGIYADTIDLLVERGEPGRAFHVLERSRSRSFLALLARRDLVFAADVPAELDRERRQLNAAYDQTLETLGALGVEEEDQRAGLRRELDEIRHRLEGVRERIRAASPRLASLQDPAPLDAGQARQLLDPGTLLLAYSLGEQRSHLFALSPAFPEPRVFRLEIGRQELADAVERWRAFLQQSRDRASIELQAERLGRELLGPAAELIAAAERLAIVPDGPLHHLPWSALRLPGGGDEQGFLIEAKPLHVLASATVFGELKGRRRPRSALRLVAFGDPDYPAGNGEFAPLPATRLEVEAVRQLDPENARVYLGEEASEERVKAVAASAEILHFACHARLDERSPLDSALALSLPRERREGEENGLLQAWEIFEELHLDAELVTLSACATASGRELGGEGILGLTRAFQYAGARSVLASLWEVGDESTAELMRRFYGYLREGASKAEALRRAQVEAMRAQKSERTFGWAAFAVFGDWR